MTKTILITGTSSGIGRETVKYFLQKGWNVCATMRNVEKENELDKLSNVTLLRMDVNDENQVKQAILEGIEKYGKIDAIVNNAGYTTLGVFESATIEQIEQQFNTNVFGVFRTIKAILPHFRDNKGGVIVNVSSLGGRMTFPLYSLYHATKWAVEGFSESISYELDALGIKIKLIEPGSVKTDFNGRSTVTLKSDITADYGSYEEKVLKNYDVALKSGSGAEPIEIAKAIFEATTDSSNQLRYPCPENENVNTMLKMRQDMPFKDFKGAIKSMLEN